MTEARIGVSRQQEGDFPESPGDAGGSGEPPPVHVLRKNATAPPPHQGAMKFPATGLLLDPFQPQGPPSSSPPLVKRKCHMPSAGV